MHASSLKMFNTQHNTVASAILNALVNNSSVNALLLTSTNIAVAAKHKNSVVITKQSAVNATLYASAQAYTQLVQASAAQQQSNASNAASVVNFSAQASKYTHLKHAHCLCTLNNNLYLQVICNSASSTYYINNVVATKQQVAQYLTTSAANAMLNSSSVQTNKTHNIQHNVVVRTYKLSSIQSVQFLNSMQVINNNCFSLA